jgi:hypothetical protein
MSEGYFRTQCRGCELLVYEGPWIPRRERQLLHERHRTLCTAAWPRARTAPTAVTAVAAPLFLVTSERRELAHPVPRPPAETTGLPRVQ